MRDQSILVVEANERTEGFMDVISQNGAFEKNLGAREMI